MLLYPPNCECGLNCVCSELREMIILSLNVDRFEHLQPKLTNQDDIHTLKLLLQVPEDHYFRQNWGKVFPLRQIHQELNEKRNHFQKSLSPVTQGTLNYYLKNNPKIPSDRSDKTHLSGENQDPHNQNFNRQT